MSWRTVIVSNISKLDYKMGYMVVRSSEGITQRILLDEIGILLIENPAVSFTGCLIEQLNDKKIRVIFCDSNRNPIAELAPYQGSHDSSSKIRLQCSWPSDIKNTIWEEIVAEKIRKQSEFLREITKIEEADLLASYVGNIKEADSTNREGFAAKVYFNALFGKGFSRSQSNVINASLNYGYSIILSAINREITANGYITQLGIFHDNIHNHFNLGCDFMEPYRILVDRKVYNSNYEDFGVKEKHEMWSLLEERVYINESRQIVRNAIKIYVKSLFDSINDKDPSVIKCYQVLEDEQL